MKATNKTARALSLSILSTFLCVVMLFGMTYAWFRVEVNSDNNVIKIGAFDAKVYYHDTYIAANAPGWADFAGATVFNTTLFPGDEVVRYIKFENNCGYPVKFDLVLPYGVTFDNDGKVNNLYVYTADSVSDTVTVSAMTSLNNLGAIGTAATAEAPTQLITKMLAANTSAIVAVGIKLPDTYSTASSTDTSETFKLRVIATQWNAPHVTVTNASAAQTLSTGQVTVTVPAPDVAVDDKLVLTVSNVVETTGTLSCDITLKKNDVTVTSAPAPIAVDINVGTGKTITSVKHNGTDIPFTYNASTGILSFTTSSFSPFEVKFLEGIYVAQIGNTGYATLEDAFAAATNNDTIVLLSDTTVNSSIEVNKSLILDLNGKTLNAALQSTGRHYYALTVYGGLTINDTSASKSGTVRSRGIQNLGGTLVINNGNFYSIDTNGGAAVWNDSDGIQYILRSEVEAARDADKNYYDTDLGISIANGVYTVVDSLSGNFQKVGYDYNGKSGDDLVKVDIYKNMDGGTLTINGGNFYAEYVGSVTDNSGPGCVNSRAGTVLTINGGTFTSANLRTYAVIANGTSEINAGTVVGAHGGLGIDTGTAVINGGSFTCTGDYYGCWITNDGTDTHVTINDGSFRGTYGLYSSVDDGGQDVSDIAISINGGTFTGTTSAAVINTLRTQNQFALTIYGGTYSSDPSDYVPDSEYTITQSNGKWIVQQSVAVNAAAANRSLLPKLITP